MKKIVFSILALCAFTHTVAAEETSQNSDFYTTAEQHITETKNGLYQFFLHLTGTKPSLYQKQLDQKAANEDKKVSVNLYQPTYVLPAYYSQKPDQAVYAGTTPDNQTLDKMEFKAQLSFLLPIASNINHTGIDLNASYTQLSFWQVYAKSQYFRETDYMPSLFISNNFLPNWQYNLGVTHQSNGRGGVNERSWNRLFADLIFSKNNWMVDINPWYMIFKSQSSDLHNPDIHRYMGDGQIHLAYKMGESTISLMSRNNFESRFKRGTLELTWSHPISKRFSVYAEGFSGFGESLIEYNHYTNAVGIGIALNDLL
jgi:phospholipase A1/A2